MNDFLDTPSDHSQAPKRNPLKWLAFFGTTCLFCISWLYQLVVFLTVDLSGYDLEIPIQSVIGFFGLVTIWVVFAMQRKIWIGLFGLFLMAWTMGLIWVSGGVFRLDFSIFGISLGPLILFGVHVGYNSDEFLEIFRGFRASEGEQHSLFEQRTNSFEEKYATKTNEQLTELMNQGLVPEAQEAIRRILLKRSTNEHGVNEG